MSRQSAIARQSYELTTEFFAIPHEDDTYLLYSPLKQILMLANGSMVDLVASLREGCFAGIDAENVDAMEVGNRRWPGTRCKRAPSARWSWPGNTVWTCSSVWPRTECCPVGR